jgi:hypothetical protein
MSRPQQHQPGDYDRFPGASLEHSHALKYDDGGWQKLKGTDAVIFSLRYTASVATDAIQRNLSSEAALAKIFAALLRLSSDHHPPQRPASRSPAQFSTS